MSSPATILVVVDRLFAVATVIVCFTGVKETNELFKRQWTEQQQQIASETKQGASWQ